MDQVGDRQANSRPSALIFDAYGTIFDVASIAEACAGLGPDPAHLVAIWRTKQLEYSFLRSLMGAAAYVDFWEITSDALAFAADQLGFSRSATDRQAALHGWLRIRPYAEAPPSLERLSAGRTCVILSNGSPTMLDEAVRGAGLTRFQAILSVAAYATVSHVKNVGGDHLDANRECVKLVGRTNDSMHGDCPVNGLSHQFPPHRPGCPEQKDLHLRLQPAIVVVAGSAFA